MAKTRLKSPKYWEKFPAGPWRCIGPYGTCQDIIKYYSVLAPDPSGPPGHEIQILDHCSNPAVAAAVTMLPELIDVLCRLVTESLTESGPMDITVREAVKILKAAGFSS